MKVTQVSADRPVGSTEQYRADVAMGTSGNLTNLKADRVLPLFFVALWVYELLCMSDGCLQYWGLEGKQE